MTERLGGNPESQPPLRARLHRYLLTTAEFALLTAMCEHCSDGSIVRPSLARLADYAKLTVKQVQRLIHGYDDRRPVRGALQVRHVPGLLERGILTQLAAKTRKPAIYRLNEEALLSDPRMRRWLHKDDQPLLPGILKPAKRVPLPPPLTDELPRSPVTVTPPSRHGDATLGTPCPHPPVTVSPYSKALNSETSDSTAGDSFAPPSWKTGDLMDYRRLRQAFKALTDSSGAAVGARREEPKPSILEDLWRTAAKEAGVPWTHALELLSRAEERDFTAHLAADCAARTRAAEEERRRRIAEQAAFYAEYREELTPDLRRQADEFYAAHPQYRGEALMNHGGHE